MNIMLYPSYASGQSWSGLWYAGGALGANIVGRRSNKCSPCRHFRLSVKVGALVEMGDDV